MRNLKFVLRLLKVKHMLTGKHIIDMRDITGYYSNEVYRGNRNKNYIMWPLTLFSTELGINESTLLILLWAINLKSLNKNFELMDNIRCDEGKKGTGTRKNNFF
jgi:hypothetical protein